MKACINTNRNQFGIKGYLSTEMCNHALEETIKYYYSLSTTISACLFETMSLFDGIGHGKLFPKLALRSAPVHIILLMANI